MCSKQENTETTSQIPSKIVPKTTPETVEEVLQEVVEEPDTENEESHDDVFVKDTCLNCGTRLTGKYCHNCGAQPDPLAVICVKCGCSLENFKKTKRIMSMGEAIKSCFSKYASFSGRARRSEYWFFNLFCTLCTLPLYIFARRRDSW